MSLPTAQIIGLQRSGTRWLFRMVNHNYNVKVRNIDKHTLPGECHMHQADAMLLIRKRPEHWLGSIRRTPTDVPKMRPELYVDGALDAVAALGIALCYAPFWISNRLR